MEVQEAEGMVYGHVVNGGVETGAWSAVTSPCPPLGSCVPLILRPPPYPSSQAHSRVL